MTTETKPTNDQNLIKRLFEAGAHFGFQKNRRHPTVKPYLFGSKQGTDIIDLQKTSELLESAKEVLNAAGKAGQTVLFVGTKEEVSKLVEEAAAKTESPYVINRWIGGTITNFGEIKKRLGRLATLTEEGESGELERKYTKKERVVIGRETAKLKFNFGGIKDLTKNPDLLVVVDPRHEHIAVTEAREKGIKIVAVMSSDNNLSLVDYPVLVNDTLQTSVSVVLDELVTAYTAGKSEYTPKTTEKPNGRSSAKSSD